MNTARYTVPASILRITVSASNADAQTYGPVTPGSIAGCHGDGERRGGCVTYVLV